MTKATRPSWTPDIDHDVEQLILLRLILSGKTESVPASVLRTAFAAHFRSLMEFFHDGRPSRSRGARPFASSDDLRLSDVLGREHRYTGNWSKADRTRLDDADKLVGHLSKLRTSRRRMRHEWGGEQDWRLLTPKLRLFLAAARQRPRWYQRSLAAARRAGLVE